MTKAELTAVTDPSVIESLSLKQVLAMFEEPEGQRKTVAEKRTNQKPTTSELLAQVVSLTYMRRQ